MSGILALILLEKVEGICFNETSANIVSLTAFDSVFPARWL